MQTGNASCPNEISLRGDWGISFGDDQELSQDNATLPTGLHCPSLGSCILEALLIPLGGCPAAALTALHPPRPPHPKPCASPPLCSKLTVDTSQGSSSSSGLGMHHLETVSMARRGHSPAVNPEAAQPILVQDEMTQRLAELNTALLQTQVRTTLDF